MGCVKNCKNSLFCQFIIVADCRILIKKSIARYLSVRDTSSRVNTMPSLRSAVPRFDFKLHCLFCGKAADRDAEYRKPVSRRRQISRVMTMPIQNSLNRIALQRSDELGQLVLHRIRSVSCLIAAEARYHAQCHINFIRRVPRSPSKRRRSGRPENIGHTVAFSKLFRFLQQNDECRN